MWDLLQEYFEVVRSPKSYNSPIGGKDLVANYKDTEIALVEVGIDDVVSNSFI